MATSLPEGSYLTCLTDVAVNSGGQTRAALLRSRIMSAQAGVTASVLTFNPANDYERRCERLTERGLLTDDVALHNIYDYYRQHDWPETRSTVGDTSGARGSPATAGPTGPGLEDLDDRKVDEQLRPDGSPWRTVYTAPERGSRRCFDYLRSDGTPFLRVDEFALWRRSSWPSRIRRVSADGHLLEDFSSLSQWYQAFVRDLAGLETAFVFVDARMLTPHLAPFEADNIHTINVLHNIHVDPPRRWNSQMNASAQRVMDRIGDLDAMVTLTRRQRDDIAQRCGASNNLFAVPNPVELPQPPAEVHRDPNLVTIVARLAGQKRLEDAIAAFAHVRQVVTQARLDIYGSGNRRADLNKEIARHRLSEAVTLRGFDTNARQALWRSSAFLMTSRFEGYPLATLESLAHGCPVVSYDIKYGPREQITDGVDGFLVSEGDVSAVADRVVYLLSSPDLVRDMGIAARAKAEAHDADHFLQDWSDVLRTIVVQKPFRCSIDHAELEVADPDPSTPRSFRGVLRARVTGRDDTVQSGHVQLSVVHPEDGQVVDVPLEVRHHGDEFHLHAPAVPVESHPGDSGRSSARLRLRLVARNAVWETTVVPKGMTPGTTPGKDS